MPEDLLMVQVPVRFTPPLLVSVWLAEPEKETATSPPSKVDAMVTAPWASIVAPLLIVIRPSVKASVPVTINVLVLLKNTATPPVLLKMTLFKVSEAGKERLVGEPPVKREVLMQAVWADAFVEDASHLATA